jgi:hypothetical protein
MADTLPPVVIELKLQVDQMQQQLKAVTGQLESVGRQAQTATAPISGLGGAFKAVGGAAAGLLAGVEVVKFLSESAQAAVTSGKSFNLMALQMQNSTGATREQSKAIDEQLEKMSLATGTVMPDLRDSYSTLVRAIGNTSEALKYEQLAQNISAATGKDLNTVSLALARAHEGNWMALNKLIPGVKNATDKFGYLEKSTRGAAEEAAKSDPYARLKAAMESIQVSIGQAFLPVLQSLADALANIAPKITDMMNAFVASPQFQSFVNSLPDVVDFLGQLANQIFPILSDLGGMVGTVFDGLAGDFTKMGNSSSSIISLFTMIRNFFDWLNTALAGLNAWNDAFNNFLAGFSKLGIWSDGLVRILKNLLNPLGAVVNGFSALNRLTGGNAGAGAGPSSTRAQQQAADMRAASTFKISGGGGGGGSGSGAGSSAATAAKQMASAIATFKQAVLVEQQKYQTDSESLLASHTKKTNDIVDAGRTKLADLYAQQQQLTADHATRVQDITATGMQKIADVVAESKNLLTNAFRDATKVDTGSMFLNAGANISNFMSMLKDKLTGAKTLADDAAKLSGLGYSQEFIDSIVSQGTQVGDALAQQLITAGPQQAAALQAQINELNQVSSHGVDDLATQINQNGNLATEDLRNQYVTAQGDLVKALGDENAAYAKSVADLTDKMSKAQSDLADALKAENDDYAKSALTMVRTYEVALAKMQVTRDQAAIKALQVGGVTKAEAKQIAAYQKDIAAENKVIAAGGTTVNVVANTNASPSQIASDVVNAIKFNAPVSVGA